MIELELIEENVVEMTPAEAEEMDGQMRLGASGLAVRLYLFHSGKGYRHVRDAEGYKFKTFHDFAEDRFDMLRNTANRWLRRVRATMMVHGLTHADVLKMYHSDTKLPKLLTSDFSDVVCKTPPDVAVKAWQEMEGNGGTQINDEKVVIESWNKAIRRIAPPPPTIPKPKPKFYCIECDGERVANEGDRCENCKKADFKILHPEPEEPKAQGVMNASGIAEFFGATEHTVQADPVTAFKVDGQTTTQTTYQPPTRAVVPVMLDNGRPVILFNHAVRTVDPEVDHVRCIVPAGMCLKEGDLFTVAIIRCQMP